MPKKNRFLASSTLSERDALKLIFLFALGSLPRENARITKLSVPTCYRFHEHMLARLHDVGWMMDDEGVFKTLSDDEDVIERFTAYKEECMKRHRGFENSYREAVEGWKYNALYVHLRFYQRTYAAELASKPNPTKEDKLRAEANITAMMVNDIVRIILQTGPLNKEPTYEQLVKAYELFSQSMERKIINFRKKRKKPKSQ